MPGEFDFIHRIRRDAQRKAASLTLGIGDDTAILAELTGRETLVTTDLLVEDVHFRLDYSSLYSPGHKTLAVSLSDIAAMGAEPRFALLSLAIPPSLIDSPQWADFFAGYFALADQHGVTLIGGDTSASPGPLVIDSIVMGWCAAGRAVRRGGARVGDAIYVTGALGASASGLELLRRGERLAENEAENGPAQRALLAHLRPQPRVSFGRAAAGLPHAMMDISDGLAGDLPHICAESGVGAILEYEAIPVAPETRLVTDDPARAMALAISGGEDYELLLTADPLNEEQLLNIAADCATPLTRIGAIVATDPAVCVNPVLWRRAGALTPLERSGYNHFART
ncbi:MAG: thiamine-phosphate kinase [Blastocatellia bacterium]